MGFFSRIFGFNTNKVTEDIEFENLVRNNGYENIGREIANILNKEIISKEVAKQFILEELDAASQGNDYARNFVRNSGFNNFEFEGTMYNTEWGTDNNIEHLQLLLRSFLMKINDIDLMVKLSISVIDNIMKEWKLGKYEKNNIDKKLINEVKKIHKQPEGVFAEINNDLASFINLELTHSNNYSDKLLVMAYGYARRIAAAGLFLQGVFNKENYKQAKLIFNSLQLQTEHNAEFQEEAFSQALEYIQSYDNRLTKNFVSLIVAAAENENTISLYEKGERMEYEKLFNIFSQSNIEEEEIPF